WLIALSVFIAFDCVLRPWLPGLQFANQLFGLLWRQLCGFAGGFNPRARHPRKAFNESIPGLERGKVIQFGKQERPPHEIAWLSPLTSLGSVLTLGPSG